MIIIRRLFCFLLLLNISITFGASRIGKITGGYEARPHSNPFVVSLQMRFLWMRSRLCTGSILNQRWILSAGHCITDSWAKWFAMDAIVGAHNLDQVTSSMIYPISHRIAHPHYRGGIGPYDIGMMKTARQIQYSVTVQPINLPKHRPLSINKDLIITGWGALQSNIFVTVIPTKLQEVRVTPLSYYDCFRAIDQIKDSWEPNPLKYPHNLCTGPTSGGIAGCTGDSGGPLVQYLPLSSEETTEAATETVTEEIETTIATTSFSPTPMTTDRPSTTTTGTTASPTPMTTNRPTTFTAETDASESSITLAENAASPTTTDDNPTTMTETSTSAVDDTETDTTEVDADLTTDASTLTVTSEATSESLLQLGNNRGTMRTKYNDNNDINLLRAIREDMVATIIGVVSWGVVPCGLRGAPTVYSNVSNYMDFINKYLYT